MPKKTRTSGELEEFYSHRIAAGQFALSHSIKETKKYFQLSSSSIEYWRKKASQNDFHLGSHGGYRYLFLLLNHLNINVNLF